MKNLFGSFLLVFLIHNSLSGQEINYSNYTHSLGIQITLGYNTFKLNDAKSFFEQLINSYQKMNIPLEVQKNYPSNIISGASIYYFPSNEFSLFLGLENTNTSAYSLYGDYAGTLDIKSKLRFYNLNFGIKKHFMKMAIVQPFIGLNAGFIWAEYSRSIKTVFSIPNHLNIDNKKEQKSNGYALEVNSGISYNIEFVILDLQVGYKFSKTLEPKLEDFYLQEGFLLDASGISFKLALRTGLYW